MVIKIRLFGALKKFTEAGVALLEVPEMCSVRELHEPLKHRLSGEFPGEFKGELVDRAALASEARVLGNHEPVGWPGTLALLPPVCGG